jgi:myo-inositol 2-dehydrogenase / D-chiro-inositol 1-dehydrogenase
MSDLRVAVVGCGRMGRERVRCALLAGARIAAVHDTDAYRASEVASGTGATLLSAPEQLANVAADAVFLCTPPDRRLEYALSCIESGIPFLIEKPVGPTAASVQGITAALARHRVCTAVGYMNRYRQSVQFARGILKDQQILGLTGFWVCRQYGVPWWLDVTASGGPHNEQATHIYDLFRYFAGEVSEVSAMSKHTEAAGPPLGVASVLQFESGGQGTLLYSCEAAAKDIGLRIFTAAGSLLLSGWDLQVTANTITDELPNTTDTEDVFLTETEAFLAAVESRDWSSIRCDWFEGLRTQELVERATGAAATATPGAKGAVVAG